MNSTSLAPVALFAYNRIEHLKLTISNLKKNSLSKFTDLIIFSDNAKKSEDIEKIIKIRSYLKKIKGFKKIFIVERNKNFGLSKTV